ncbi:hypothetical protein HB763_11385 [Vibrio campbellii]|uniref:hypothetical protein n=1 Tax=Vibrio campbellii TaxID=680 RepID=UPI002109AD55|nr:hypothetical protein [Vibrio campbellii]UTZ37245.1 hypothetical protein HB763_11385 [Vibrio campbellii]
MRKFTLLSLLFLSMPVLSGAFSNAAVPTRIDIERGNGFMVYGNFGNPMNCTNEGRFFIQKTHPQYSEIYSTILAAFTANKKIKLYSSSCQPAGWYSKPEFTYNTVTPNGTVYILN